MPGSNLCKGAQKDVDAGKPWRVEEAHERSKNDLRAFRANDDCNGEEVVRIEGPLDEHTSTSALVELGQQVPAQGTQPQLTIVQYAPGQEEDAEYEVAKEASFAGWPNSSDNFNNPDATDPFNHLNAIDPYEEDPLPTLDEFDLDWTPTRVFNKNRLQVYRYFCLSFDGTLSIKYLTIGKWSGQELKAPVPKYFWRNKDYVFHLPPGDWNCANLAIVKRFGQVRYVVFRREWKDLPRLHQQAMDIWPELQVPRIEFTELERSMPIPYPPAFNRVPRASTACCVKHPVFHEGKHMVMKYWPTPACLPDRIENEMRAYRACVGKDLTPEFLSLVTEAGRVIGFLLEYLEGAHKPRSLQEKEMCRQQVKRFHNLTGWHRSGPENRRSNFLVKDDRVWLIDLAKAKEPQTVGRESPSWAERVTEATDFDAFWNFAD